VVFISVLSLFAPPAWSATQRSQCNKQNQAETQQSYASEAEARRSQASDDWTKQKLQAKQVRHAEL